MSDDKSPKPDFNNYSKIILPTIDTILCRGTNIFAQPPTKNGENTIIVLPREYFKFLSQQNFKVLRCYTPDMEELFRKSASDMIRFVDENKVRFDGVNSLDVGIDLAFLDVKSGKNLADLVTKTENILAKKVGENKVIDAKKEESILEVQATLSVPRAELVLNGIDYAIPKYRGLSPSIADRFLVEVDSLSDTKRFEALSKAVKTELIKEGKGEFENPYVLKYLPFESFNDILGNNPIPNQFLVMTDMSEATEGGEPEVTAYRMKHNKRRLEKVDFENLTQKINHIWKPKKTLDVKQFLALDVLLDPEVKMVYVIGGKQTGKTSLVMAAFESYIFGKGGSPSKSKSSIEEHITLIKSGLPDRPMSQEELKMHYSSYRRAFSEQELGIMPFDELLKSNLERTLSGGGNKAQTKDAWGVGGFNKTVLLPNKAPFVLQAPGDAQGMSYTGYTIRDECQNEYPHVMKEFLSRRGPGAKMALLGDLYDQITRPGLDELWNGLLLSMYKNSKDPRVAVVVLTECWAAR